MEISSALLAAQERLLQRRTTLSIPSNATAGEERPGDASKKSFELQENNRPFPAHLGHGSQRVTDALRRITPFAQHKQIENSAIDLSWTDTIHFEKSVSESPAPLEKRSVFKIEIITVSPDLITAAFQCRQTSILRLYYLFRYLDTPGSGHLDENWVRNQLTAAESTYRICGRKRFGQLLNSGMELFWTMSNGRIWLRSLPKVLDSLGVTRLHFRSVDMPLNSLLNSMSKTNAHLYATIHSGRNRDTPISRAAITELTGIPKTTQIQYEKTAGIGKTLNYAIGSQFNHKRHEEIAWQRGTAVFTLTDYLGLQGIPGAKYIAWQMPNSYRKLYTYRSRSRRKRINNKLGLVIHREPGNRFVGDRFYYADGKHAAEVANRGSKHEIYWPHWKTKYGDQLHCIIQPQSQLGGIYS